MTAGYPISASSRFAGREPRLRERLLARLRARSIDESLLAGGSDNGNRVTLARRARLLDRRHRTKLARALRRMLEAARRGELSLFVAQIPLQLQEVLETEPLILTLASELEEEERVSPRGVILADRLIRDGDSPVYWRGEVEIRENPAAESVEVAVKHARAALHLG
jgi:hypothetical protein